MFYFQLAEQLGCPVGELLQRISSKEITEWQAYFKIKQDEEKKNQPKESKGKPNKKPTFGKG